MEPLAQYIVSVSASAMFLVRAGLWLRKEIGNGKDVPQTPAQILDAERTRKLLREIRDELSKDVSNQLTVLAVTLPGAIADELAKRKA